MRLRERPIPNIDSDDEEEIAVQNNIQNDDEEEITIQNTIQNGTGIIHNDYQIPIGQNDEDGNQSNGASDWENNVDLNLEQVLVQNDNSGPGGDNSVEIKEEIWDPIAITEADAAELSRVLNANDSEGDLVIPNDNNSCAPNGELNDPESDADNSESDDSIVWENPEVVVLKPSMYTEDALPKRENDPVSGEMPFAEKVSNPTT